MEPIRVQRAIGRRDLRAFVTFPWRVYQGDRNWVPPLISESLHYLNPATGVFYRQAEVALFLARRGRAVLGTIAAFVDHRRIEHTGRKEGGFGFFEVLPEYAAAERLLEAAWAWLRQQGMESVYGPTNFTEHERPGVLVGGADCPPVMLAGHTPPYYQDFLERFGMERDHDIYAWRAPLERIGPDLSGLPPEIARVAEVARRDTRLTIRKARLADWDREVAIIHHLFNATLSHLPEYSPISEAEFGRLAGQMRPFLDVDLALLAEVEGRAIGFCIAIPDLNRVLIRLNGRLFPLNWLKVRRYIREIDVVSFKLMGIVEEYRRRGIDALLYMETLRTACQKGYRWLDGSLASENNPAVNVIAARLGAERYKHYRLYRMAL